MILEVLCFLLGVHLSMMLIAACYRLVDLWYRITDFIFGILTRIAVVAALNAIFILVLPDDYQSAFINGQIFFLTFHIVIFWIGRVFVIFLTRR